jgi:XTP/dITP diphosphohydrolase
MAVKVKNTRIIIATSNSGKLKEIRHILKGVKLPIICLADLPQKFHIKENGKTFFANAVKKTLPVSKAYPDDLVCGEDSGLSVDFLGGKPGVYSRRYSGKNATDPKNNKKLLKELLGAGNRKCSYHCSLVLMKSGKLLKNFEGRLSGKIHSREQGTNGFGYDPVFYLSKYKKTVAQLPLSIKNKFSHRAWAFKKLSEYLLFSAKISGVNLKS